MRRLARFLRGDISRAAFLRGLLPLLIVCFFGSMAVAATRFPRSYDWRYRPMSNLLSPRDNPQFYPIAVAGLVATGVLLLPSLSYITRRLALVAPRAGSIARICFSAGAVLLVLAALVVPQHVHPVFGFSRLHEMLARSSAIAVGVGMLCCCWAAIAENFRVKQLLHPRLPASWIFLTAAPISAALVTLLIGLVAQLRAPFANALRQSLKHSAFWHLGFWEWLGTVAVFCFVFASALLLPDRAAIRESASRRD